MTVLQTVLDIRQDVTLYHILESVLLQQSCVYVAPYLFPFCSRLDKSSNSMISGVQETAYCKITNNKQFLGFI